MAYSGLLTISATGIFVIIFGALFQNGWCFYCVQ